MRSTGDPELDVQLARFGANMREARQRAGLSQIDLSFRADLDRAAISFLERAERSPDLSTIVRVADAVGAGRRYWVIPILPPYEVRTAASSIRVKAVVEWAEA
jgi:transcriptional regulator with XRE-family HTH domain